MSNQLNMALANTWLALDMQQHEAVSRRESRDAFWDLKRLNYDLWTQQGEVEEERSLWNSIGQTLGCAGGGIIGFIMGGAVGAMKGCQTGGQVVGTVTDWIYDGSDWDTEAELELQKMEKEFATYGFNYSDYARKYQIQDKLDYEQDIVYQHLDMLESYDKWEDEFYDMKTGDYLMDLATIGFEFAASDAGGKILSGMDKHFKLGKVWENFMDRGATDLPIVGQNLS